MQASYGNNTWNLTIFLAVTFKVESYFTYWMKFLIDLLHWLLLFVSSESTSAFYNLKQMGAAHSAGK